MNNIVLFALTRHERCLYDVTKKVCIKQYVSDVEFPSGTIATFVSKEPLDRQKLLNLLGKSGHLGFMLQPFTDKKWLALPNTFADYEETKIYKCRDYLRCVSFSHDGRSLFFACEASYYPCRVLQTQSDMNRRMMFESKYFQSIACSIVHSMALNPNGKDLAFACQENTHVQLCKISNCVYIKPDVRVTGNFRRCVQRLAWSPDGQILGVSYWGSGLIEFLSPEGSTSIDSIGRHDETVQDFDFSPDASLLALGYGDKTVSLWDIQTGECIQTYKGHTRAVSCVKYCPKGNHIVSGSWDHTLKLWSTETNTCVRTFTGHTAEVKCVAFHPTGQFFVSGSNDCTVKVWDIMMEACLKTFKHFKRVTDVDFRPDGNAIASCSRDKTIRLWAEKPNQ